MVIRAADVIDDIGQVVVRVPCVGGVVDIAARAAVADAGRAVIEVVSIGRGQPIAHREG
ncbi:hypothetical protein D3C80_1871900 [compost metagenome]